MKSNGANAPRAWSRRWAAMILMTCLLPAGTLAAQDDGPDRAREGRLDRMHWILEGLERGMESLAALERRDAQEVLERIANEVRREMELVRKDRPRRRARGDEERRFLEEQTEVLRLAMRALIEGERHDAAHLVELAIHARELQLAGRQDPEAREIRERAPNREQVIELLVLAEGLYREFDLDEMADRVIAMTEELWGERGERGERARGRESDRERARGRERNGERRERERAERGERNERRRADRAERSERRRAERGRRGQNEANDRARERIEQLHERLADLQREIEALRRELQHRE